MKTTRLIITILTLLLISACNIPKETEYQSYFINQPESKSERPDSSKTKTIEIWTPEDIVTNTLRYFSYQHDEIEFEVTVVDRVSLVDTYYEALLSNTEPDLMIVSAQDIGAFSGLDTFETLNHQPYYDNHFFSSRPKALLDNYLNDQDEMYGFPIHTHPYVTMYRADILDEYGFPTDPAELGDYLADIDHWLEIVTRLADDDLYAYESLQVLLEWGLNSSYPFDQNYQYIYQEEPFSDLLEGLAVIEEMELDVYQSVWQESGYNHLKDDRLVMFQAPSYMVDTLYDWFPEQAGKWRITKPPFEMNGIAKNTSLIAMIPENASNKNVVWDLVKALANDLFYGLSTVQEHPLLDQADLNQFYLSLLGEPSTGKPSMLDKTAEVLWENNVYRVNQGYQVSEAFFQQTHNQVIEQVRNNRRVLSEN